jgi:hypothetical protein
MLGTLVVFVALLGFVMVTSTRARVAVDESRRSLDKVRADALSTAGKERAIQVFATALRNSSVLDPLEGIEQLFDGGPVYAPYTAEPVLDGSAQIGAFSVTASILSQTGASITLAIDSTGYVPDAPQNLEAGRAVDAWTATRTTVRYTVAPSRVFDYAYFINNWGWFYGNTIYCGGNARSNGQFDVAGYKPTITGQPIYDGVAWNGTSAALSGYHDDNEDTLLDGMDGGIFSSWDIVGASQVKGNGGLAKNQHDFEDPIPMPNISNLKTYEQKALDFGSSIKIDGVTVCNSVYGDEKGEKKHLYLVGTATKPIVINGPVVVRGSVVIRGVVSGQGVIVAGGNVYVPNSITYKNKPSSPRPAGTTQAQTEAWLSANWNKDFLGLIAKENVVVGNYTNSTWQHYVNSWMNSPLNKSEEDAGLDGIPNTKKGKDGIAGTADDDLLEGDGVFSVEKYTACDAELGLIPDGYSVGDVIPGSGEDLDGDGVYDGPAKLADLALPAAINTTNWGGNVPAGGVSSYSSISSMYATNLDAVFYTNHSFCYVVLGSTTARINGGLVSRNENIIYGTPTIETNHDARLLGSSTGKAAGWLPREIQDVEVLRWSRLDQDPNANGVTP